MCIWTPRSRWHNLKFFTPAAYRRFDSSEDYRLVYDRYLAHIESLRGRVPDRILNIPKKGEIQDALISQVRHDRVEKELTLVLRCGETQVGYFDLEMRYVGAQITPKDDHVLAKLARSVKSRRKFGGYLSNFEIDLTTAGRLEHRFLFATWGSTFPDKDYVWFSIRCQDLKWRTRPVKTRRLAAVKDRYPNGPPTP